MSVSVYYKKSSDEDTSKGRSSDQACLRDESNDQAFILTIKFLIAVAGGGKYRAHSGDYPWTVNFTIWKRPLFLMLICTQNQ